MRGSASITADMKDADFYDRRYYDDDGKSNYLGYTRRSSPFDRHASLVLAFMRAVGENSSQVLDIGCAKGFLVEALHARKVRAYGVDWSRYASLDLVVDARPNVVLGSALELPFRDDAFAIAVSFDLLEHFDLDSALLALHEAARVSAWQLHQVNTGRLAEWLFDGDESHCLKLPLDGWQEMARHAGLPNTLICEPDGRTAYSVQLASGSTAAGLRALVNWMNHCEAPSKNGQAGGGRA